MKPGSQEGSALLKVITYRANVPSIAEIRRRIRAKLAIVTKGALRNISLCEARFLVPPRLPSTLLNWTATNDTQHTHLPLTIYFA